MKRFSRRTWRRRRALTVVLLVLGTMALAVYRDDLLAPSAVLAAMVLLDWAVLLLTPGPRRSDLVLSSSFVVPGRREGLVTGGTVALVARVKNRGPRGFRSLLAAPLTPAHMKPLDAGHAWADLPAGDEQTHEFTFRAERVGTSVFPGVLVSWHSPLTLFSRTLFLSARREIHVLPDYGRSAHPALSRLLRSGPAVAEQERRRAVRGTGNEFAEIREYRPKDSMRRVDWKATARRNRLLVREFEEPREFTVRILLDGSSDMTEGESGRVGFARAADLIGKFAHVALTGAVGLKLTVYDRSAVLERSLRGDRAGFRRLLADLVAVPGTALLRGTRNLGATGRLEDLARRRYRATAARWGGREGPEDFGAFLTRTQGEGHEDPARFLTDFDPGCVARFGESCGGCGRVLFVDEARCVCCAWVRKTGEIPPRAGCLVELLGRSLRASRGREMLVLISSFRGGEARREVADLLALAATGYRQVHVVLPTPEFLRNAPATMPGSFGSYPSMTRRLLDAETLFRVEAFRGFEEDLLATGVEFHPLEDELELDGLVMRLLLTEVLTA